MHKVEPSVLTRPARVAAVRRLSGKHARVRSAVEAMLRGTAVLLDVPTVSVDLVDDAHEMVWVTSSPEVHQSWTFTLRQSLCALVVRSGEELAVSDVRTEINAAFESVDADAVSSVRGVDSYLGVPLVVDGGLCVGSVCAYGTPGQVWTEAQRLGLRHVSEAVASLLNPIVEGRQDDHRRTRGASKRDVRRVAAEHAALRRVATLAAHADEPGSVLQAAVDELSALLAGAPVVLARIADEELTPVAAPTATSAEDQMALCRTWRDASGPIAACSAVVGGDEPVMGAPISVGGVSWGVLLATFVRTTGAHPVEAVEQFSQIVAIALDNAERRRRLDELITTDPVSGLPNARALAGELRRQFAKWRRHGHPFAVALLEVDDSAAREEWPGADAHEETLREIATVLTDHTREEEMVSLMDGDEFCVVLNTHADEACLVAERLRTTIETGPIDIATVSAGVCDARHATDGDHVLRLAARALDAAKAAGGNTTRRCLGQERSTP